MTDLIVIGILIILIGASVAHIIKEKKRGTRCIGCPHAGNCSSRNCSSQTDANK